MNLRNKKLIASIIMVTICSTLSMGCTKDENSKEPIIISNDVKKDSNSGVLKVISEEEFSLKDLILKDLPYEVSNLFFDKNNELYFIGSVPKKDGNLVWNDVKVIIKDTKIEVEEINKEKNFGYEFEKISGNKALIKKYTGVYEQWEVDLGKLNNNPFFESNHVEKVIKGEIYGNFSVGNNKLVLGIYDKKNQEIDKYKKVAIYDLISENWKNIDVPRKVYIGDFIRIFDNKIIYIGSNVEGAQFPSHIGIIDLKENKMVTPMEANVGVQAVCPLNESTVLVKGYTKEGEAIELLNLENKVSKTLTNLNFESENHIANAENSNRFSYVEKNKEGLWDVVVCTLNGNEIEGKNVIYSYKDDKNKVTMSWSKDGKVLALGERTFNEPLTSLKIFKFE